MKLKLETLNSRAVIIPLPDSDPDSELRCFFDIITCGDSSQVYMSSVNQEPTN